MVDPSTGHQRYYIFILLFTLPLFSSSLTDREILNALYDATSGDDWDRGWDTWRNPDTTICEWEGVTCTDDEDDEKVASISLSKNKLKGEVPMTLLLQLSELRDLTLDDNDVTFPSQIKEDDLMDENKNEIQSDLRELNLDETNVMSLEGIFGKADGSGVAVKLDKLRILKMEDVGLDGPFPSQILKLTNLRELDLSINELEGSLPEQLSFLTKLKTLDLSENDFTGEIPDNIGNLDKLEILDLSENSLSGPLKNGIAKLTNMKYLDFNENELTGPILPLVGMFKLKQVDYSDNNFSGPIPANFLDDIDPSDFLNVDLSDNQLDGVIPTEPFKNLKPDTFWIANNKITGIEDTLCNTPAAGEFGCNGILCPPGTSAESGNGNKIDGDCQSCVLAADYFGSTACNENDDDDDDDDDDDADDDNEESGEDDDADDDDNGIDGDPKQFVRDVLTNLFQSCGGVSWAINTGWGSDASVCTWHGVSCAVPGDESSVTSVRLRGHNIVGNIPNAIFRLPQLNELKLGGNNVMVSFDDMKYAKMLKMLDLSSIGGISGVGISGAAYLEDLNLDNAHLSGPLAAVAELFELRHLKKLSINHNALTGPIPDSIKNLNKLTYLSMFDNNLSGELPYSLSLLNELSVLNLRENAFSGPLPDYLNQMESLTAIDLSEQTHSDSSGFTGPLLSFKHLTKIETFDLSFNKLTGAIPSDFLEEVEADMFEGISLEGNLLTGEVPALANNKMVLVDNHFTSVSLSFCESFGALYDQFQCDAVMCPIGTFHQKGRRVAPEDICASCPSNEYMGGTSCATDDGGSPYEKSEKDILQRFYSATTGQNWGENFGWEEESNHCLWKGIQCEQDQVVSIVLDDNALEGVLLKDIFNLEKLQKLSLKQNSITVSFDGIENAKSLKSLYLGQTRISTLDGLEKATILEELNLNFNSFHSSFPTNILALTKLKVLQLAGNGLSGNIPDLKELPDLEYLQLGNNKFQGPIPAFDLKAMKELNLNSNSLMGQIPPSISQAMPVLESLDLSSNKDPNDATNHPGLTGPIPNFELSPRLTYLDLSVNSLSAGVSTDFLAGVSANEFRKLDLSDNELTGNVPNILNGFDVKMMKFVGNKFTSIDPLLCQRAEEGDCTHIMCSPKTFAENVGRHTDEWACSPCPTMNNDYFGNTKCISAVTPQPTPSPVEIVPIDNGLTEEIILDKLYQVCGGQNWRRKDGWEDPSIPHCDRFGIQCRTLESGLSVTSIELESNSLIGTPPIELYQLAHLNKLNLDGNDILFDFTDIERATNLEYLFLGKTKIVSINGIKNAKNLISIRLDQNDNMVDLDLNEIYSLTKLNALFLDGYKINGPFPMELTSLNVGWLSLPNCGLTGELPVEIGLMKHLVFLKLDHNALEGPIPSDIPRESDLMYLDLSHNRLSGPLPSFSSLENLKTLDLSNNQLTGNIPQDFFQNMVPSIIEKIDISNNALAGVIAAPIARIVVDNQLSQNVVDLTGNQFSSIDDTVCVGQYSCQGIVCGIGMYNPLGRQKSDEVPCINCPTAMVLGAKDCVEDDGSSSGDESDDEDDNVDLPDERNDRDILNSLFIATNGYNWQRLNNWGNDDVSICEWEGITCTDVSEKQQVRSINLYKNNMQGTVPMTKLLQLPFLEELSLGDNNDLEFPNYINPTEVLDEHKDEIRSNLKSLNLEDCRIYGNLAGIFGNADGSGTPIILENLKALNLADSGLPGAIPPQILKLTNLKELILSDNELEGEIPAGLSALKDLKVLDLSDNEFGGEIPEWIGQLTELETLDLGLNALTGPMKNVLNTMLNLVYLSFSDNRLTGQLLPLENLKKLNLLDLEFNLITGQIPTNFLANADHKNMDTVDLAGNKLTGEVPLFPFSNFNPGTFMLNDNQFTAINSELCDTPTAGGHGCDGILCKPLTYNSDGYANSDQECISCDSQDSALAKFWGISSCAGDDNAGNENGTPVELPNGMTDRDILKALFDATSGSGWSRDEYWGSDDVSICQWEGIVCTEDTSKEQVKSISLSKNNMKGMVPMTKLLQMPYLVLLNLSNNEDLEFPDFIDPNVDDRHKNGIRSSLKRLNFGDCDIDNLDGIFGNADGSGIQIMMNNLVFLNLEDCGLDGPFPPQVLKFTNLRELNLADNDFEGVIPDGLSSLKDLGILDLSDNAFEGEIPDWIGQLTGLEILDLGDNLLRGPLKSALNTITNLVHFSVTENSLTGSMISLKDMSKLKSVDFSSNRLVGQIPTDFLASINQDAFLNVDLSDNMLTGQVPAAPFKKLRPDTFWVMDNQITSIDPELCDSPAAGGYGCDGIACPGGYYNNDGHADEDQKECLICNLVDPSKATFMGSTDCDADDDDDDDESEPSEDQQDDDDDDNGKSEFDSERDILMKFYDSCNGQSWYHQNNWGGHSICNWEGIKCVESQTTVEEIVLGSNNIECVPPLELFELPNLKKLSLYGNFITFSFYGISNAKKLEELSLDNTNPGTLNGLEKAPDSLKRLTLNKCGLDGSFPSEILNLVNLEYLSIAHNSLTGSLPSGLSNMINLDTLNVGNNELTGGLKDITISSNLKEIDLSGNNFDGTIPTTFLSNLPTKYLINIDLSSNLLTGTIPASLERFELLNIDLKDNFLTGINDNLCKKNSWNDGLVGKYGCDALLCPKGYTADSGKQLSEKGKCVRCAESEYYGDSRCFAVSSSQTSFTSWSIKVFAVGATLFLTCFS